MTWLLNVAFQVTKDWGLAILTVSLLVRLSMFPLNIKQQRAMQKMQKLQPKMDELKQKYKNNQQELNRKLLELQMKEGVTGAGCFLSLLQFPVFIFLYRAINSLTISSGSILIPWVVSLGSADPFHLIPILYGVIQIIGVIFKGNQQNLMQLVPYLLLIGFLWNASASMGIYWIVNGVFGIIEGFYMKKAQIH